MILKQKFIWLLTAIMLIIVLMFMKSILNQEKVEDAWVCSEGRWVKQGSPTTPRPTTKCIR